MPNSPTCTTCSGNGYIEDQICNVCLGQGALPVRGVNAIFSTLITQINDLDDKCNNMQDNINDIKEKVDETKEVCEKILQIVGKSQADLPIAQKQ